VAFTDKQQAFIDEYLKCWNATEAALRAGYSERTAYSQGSRLLKNVEIAEEIQQRVSERAMGVDEVLIRLAEQARGAVDEFIDVKAGLPYFDWERLQESGKLHLIKKIKYNSDGRPEVEFYDAQAALVHIGRVHGLFTDKRELSGPDGGALQVRVTGLEDLSDDELDTLLEA
jgi:phage terminase small subunit